MTDIEKIAAAAERQAGRKPKKPRVWKGWAEFHADGRLFKDGLGNVLVYGRRPDKRMRKIMGDVRPVIVIAAFCRTCMRASRRTYDAKRRALRRAHHPAEGHPR